MSPWISWATNSRVQDDMKVEEVAKGTSPTQVSYQALMVPCPTCQGISSHLKPMSLLVGPPFHTLNVKLNCVPSLNI